jgi:hypothetical protein
METDDYCSQCSHKDTCKEVYAKLGQYQGPSVAWDVVWAFGLPIAIFIAGAAACQRYLNAFLGEKTLILASFACGFVLAVVFAAGIRVVRGRLKGQGAPAKCRDCDEPAGSGAADAF